MTIAFDSASARTTFGSTPDPFLLSFTPVGTPAGILVLLHTANTTVDLFTSVSYGGVPMTEVRSEAGGTNRTEAYFLGQGIPSGTQNVSIDHTGTTSGKRVMVFCVTATSGRTAVADHDAVSGSLMNDPNVTLQTGADDTFIAYVARIWANSAAQTSPGTGFTHDSEASETNGIGVFGHGTSIFTGGDVLCQVVDTVADDKNLLAVAIKELPPTRKRAKYMGNLEAVQRW